jgi:hypothetical protein
MKSNTIYTLKVRRWHADNCALRQTPDDNHHTAHNQWLLAQ